MRHNIVEEYAIREAKPEDIDDIVRFRLLIQEHMERCNKDLWHLSEGRKKELKEVYLDQMSNDRSRLVIVKLKQDDSNVGMGLGRTFRNDAYIPNVYGRIDDIWINPEHRRKGLCRLIVRGLIDFFDSNSIEHIILNYVNGNLEAETVWPHLGFRPVLITGTVHLQQLKKRIVGQTRNGFKHDEK